MPHLKAFLVDYCMLHSLLHVNSYEGYFRRSVYLFKTVLVNTYIVYIFGKIELYLYMQAKNNQNVLLQRLPRGKGIPIYRTLEMR